MRVDWRFVRAVSWALVVGCGPAVQCVMAAEPYRAQPYRAQPSAAVVVNPALIVTEFAVPVAVPVAPFSPVWYASSAYVQANAIGAWGAKSAKTNIALASPPEHGESEQIASSAANTSRASRSRVAVAVGKNRSAAEIFERRCTSCHAGQQPQGGLNLQQVDAIDLSRTLRQEILVRVTSGDPARRMPPGNEALTSDEFLSLVKELVR